jgi:putative transposase
MAVDWFTGAHINKELVKEDLHNAVKAKKQEKGLTIHSNRGLPYISYADQSLLGKNGRVQSMSGASKCSDNAVMDSFFDSLKKAFSNKL